MANDINYERDKKIDETALDVEALEQPGIFMKYSQHAAQKQKEEDEAQEELDLVVADLDKKIRQNPEAYDLLKATEATVANAIKAQPEYQEKMEKLISAKYERKVAQGAVRTMDHRKEMIQELVKLHGQSYFAGPRVPRDLSQEYKKRKQTEKAANQAVGSNMKRKRSK